MAPDPTLSLYATGRTIRRLRAEIEAATGLAFGAARTGAIGAVWGAGSLARAPAGAGRPAPSDGLSRTDPEPVRHAGDRVRVPADQPRRRPPRRGGWGPLPRSLDPGPDRPCFLQRAGGVARRAVFRERPAGGLCRDVALEAPGPRRARSRTRRATGPHHDHRGGGRGGAAPSRPRPRLGDPGAGPARGRLREGRAAARPGGGRLPALRGPRREPPARRLHRGGRPRHLLRSAPGEPAAAAARRGGIHPRPRRPGTAPARGGRGAPAQQVQCRPRRCGARLAGRAAGRAGARAGRGRRLGAARLARWSARTEPCWRRRGGATRTRSCSTSRIPTWRRGSGRASSRRRRR